MAEAFFEQSILNSPHEIPTWHQDVDEDGQPTGRLRFLGHRMVMRQECQT